MCDCTHLAIDRQARILDGVVHYRGKCLTCGEEAWYHQAKDWDRKDRLYNAKGEDDWVVEVSQEGKDKRQ